MTATDLARIFIEALRSGAHTSRITLFADEALDDMPEPERRALLVGFEAVAAAVRGDSLGTAAYEATCERILGSKT